MLCDRIVDSRELGFLRLCADANSEMAHIVTSLDWVRTGSVALDSPPLLCTSALETARDWTMPATRYGILTGIYWPRPSGNYDLVTSNDHVTADHSRAQFPC
jgi:hypothetical protein